MRGADLLLRSLAESGVEICFANPGTSEMHLVAALDAAPSIRPVLTLHENVASGAADGWGRMTGRPASTLLHLGPGLANALSNLHNAKRAATPIVNIVGEHASYHVANDPPLGSDIAALARTVSAWVQTVPTARAAGDSARAAVAAALGPPGAIATLIVPSDAAWNEVVEEERGVDLRGTATEAMAEAQRRAPPGGAVDAARVDGVARALATGEPTMLLLGGRAMAHGAVELAARVAAHTGAQLCCTSFTAVSHRGAGSVAVERLPYFPEAVAARLAAVRHLVLVDAPPPVAFFAYPDMSTVLLPASCDVQSLSDGADDVSAALDALVQATGARDAEPLAGGARHPPAASGPITSAAFAQTLAAVLPDGAIVCDEAITNRFPALVATAGARPHDWCCVTGGSLGTGLPMSFGAALAAPGRRVINLQADGSAMYTPQALWSLAREGVDVTTVILANRRYRILDFELQRLGLTSVARGRPLTDLTNPSINFVQLAESLGVPAEQVDSTEALARAMQRSFAEPGPRLIVAMMVD